MSLGSFARAFSVGCLVLAAAGGVIGREGRAEAAIVERVVAVVGERPILLSELRHRARPFLFRIAASSPNPAQQAAAESEMFRELLNRMIDDRLEDVAAEKAHLAVSSEEIDNAIRNVASSQGMSSKDLMGAARREGLSEQDYRDELRRQILEGKLVQLRVRGRVRVTEQDARAAYARLVREMGNQIPADVRILALKAPQNIFGSKMKLAQSLVDDARNGKDFCQLVSNHSEDTQTRDTCGSRGAQPLSAYEPAELRNLLATMKSGQISDPLVVTNMQNGAPNQAILIAQLLTEPKVPGFEEVRDRMTERAFSEAMERQRKLWLQELRSGVYVDVRL